MEILAISGSLRHISSNTSLLQATGILAPEAMHITLYQGIGDLPHFNPDIEDQDIESVLKFRARLRDADGILISSPEYAHGVPGVLKNALDWVVGSGELIDKPVALLNASPYSLFAHAQLTETITVMSAKVIAKASITVPLAGKKLDDTGIAAHAEIAPMLKAALQAFAEAIELQAQVIRI